MGGEESNRTDAGEKVVRYSRPKTGITKETELCAEFIKLVPEKEWTVYPETGGFDILLVRKSDGFQIGVEAKLKLNAKVISQAAENAYYWHTDQPGPDARAVLVPDSASELASVCGLLGIEVIRLYKEQDYTYFRDSDGRMRSEPRERFRFHPELPHLNKYRTGDWFDHCPHSRLKLPDYIPDTIAGDKSPVMLTDWKIRAMKLTVILDRQGYLTRKDFKKLEVSISRWIQGGLRAWLVQGSEYGNWVRTEHFPDFAKQHPVNFEQIKADFENWNPYKEIA